MEQSTLCRFPDRHGRYNLRCAHVIEAPRGEKEPRQCRMAAIKGTKRCLAHQGPIIDVAQDAATSLALGWNCQDGP